MIEITFTRPLTFYNSSGPINSALFSKVKPLRSPRVVSLNSFNFDQKRCNTSKGFRHHAFREKPFSFVGKYLTKFSVASANCKVLKRTNKVWRMQVQ